SFLRARQIWVRCFPTLANTGKDGAPRVVLIEAVQILCPACPRPAFSCDPFLHESTRAQIRRRIWLASVLAGSLLSHPSAMKPRKDGAPRIVPIGAVREARSRIWLPPAASVSGRFVAFPP